VIKMAAESSDMDSDWTGSTLMLTSNVHHQLCVAEMDSAHSVIIRAPRAAWSSDSSHLHLQSHPDTATEQQLKQFLSSSSRTSVVSECIPGELQVNRPMDPPWTSATVDLLQDQLGVVASPTGVSTAGRMFPPPRPVRPSQLTEAQTSHSAPLITVRPKSSPSLRFVQLKDIDEIQVHTSNPRYYLMVSLVLIPTHSCLVLKTSMLIVR